MLFLKNFIRKRLDNYPFFAFIILYFSRKLRLSSRALNSDFPISNIKELVGYNEPFCCKKKSEGFFLRFYPMSNSNLYHINKFYSLVRSHLFVYEILWAKKTNTFKIKNKLSQKNLIAISHFNKKKQIFKINDENRRYNIELEPEKYSYLSFKTKKLKITSDKDFIVSKNFLKKKIQRNNKIVIAIFIDGLNNFNNLSLFKKYAPETFSFFKKENIFQNHFSNSEWTVPSCATIMTGKNTHNHGIFHPNANHDISKKNKIMPQFFQENNYVTLMCNSGWRTSPGYGYVKGFDRTIYKKEANANFLISESLNHLNSFQSFNNFIYLGLNDLHHNLDLVPPLTLQINSKPSLIYSIKNDEKIKSVNEKLDKKKVEILKQNTLALDKKLSILYSYLEKNYKDNFVISIFTDHGHSFMGNDQYILSKTRTSIPFLLKIDEKKNDLNIFDNKNLSSNIDILPTLLGACGINNKNRNFDGINLLAKNKGKKIFKRDIIIESIYPNKKYQAKIINHKNSEYIFNLNNHVDYKGRIILKEKPIKSDRKMKLITNNIKAWNKKHCLNNKSF